MKMNSFNTNAHDFRSSKRKCFSLTSCLIFVLLMSQASCRPSAETQTETDKKNVNSSNYDLTYDKDYVDVDDIDWKNFAAVETTSKVHPIIFYKEDIVSEDYDPRKEKNKTSVKHHAKEIKQHHRRKYKEISRHHKHRNQTESYKYIKPEKVYFDINPIEHHDVQEASDEDENQFNGDNIHIEVISLLDDDNTNDENGSADKQLDISKNLVDTYTRRYRRDVPQQADGSIHGTSASVRPKRNPFYHRTSHYANQLPHYRGVFFRPEVVIYPVKTSDGTKHPIKSPNYYNAYSPSAGINVVGKKPTTSPQVPIEVPESITQRFDDSDRPVWPIETSTRRPVNTPDVPMRTLPPRRPPPPILQFGDEDYVASNSNTVNNRNSRPIAAEIAPEIPFQIQMTSRPPTFATRAPATTPAPSGSGGVSACIWAISSCCTRNEQIRYQCFERLGCSGAFWDLNPCADNIVRLAVQAADQYLE